jgi:hypothetical protein
VSKAASVSFRRRTRARRCSHFETIFHLFVICEKYPLQQGANAKPLKLSRRPGNFLVVHRRITLARTTRRCRAWRAREIQEPS